MINESIKKITSKVFSGFETAAKVGGNLLLDELISEIESRSPTVVKLGSTLKNKIVDLRKTRKISTENYKNFVEKDIESAKEFRAEVSKNNPGLQSQKEIDKATLSVIKTIEKSIKENPEKAKESGLYKQYGKNFEAYSKVVKEQTEAAKKALSNPISETTDASGARIPGPGDKAVQPQQVKITVETMSEILAGMKEELDKNESLDEKTKKEFLDGAKLGMEEELAAANSSLPKSDKVKPAKNSDFKILDEIAANTEKTVEILDKKLGNTTPGTSTTESPKTIQAAFNSIGSNFLTKIFTEKTLIQITDKIKNSLGIEEEIKKSDVSSEKNESPVLEEIKKTNSFLEAEKNESQADEIEEDEIRAESKLRTSNENVSPEKAPAARIDDTKTSNNPLDDYNSKSRKQTRSSDPIKDKTIQTSRDKNYTPGSKSEAPKKIGGGRLAGVATAASGALATGALWAGGAALAGAAGYGVGTLASKGIDAGLSAVTGSETSLGSWVYDKFNDDPMVPKPGEKNSASGKINSANVAKSVPTVIPESTSKIPLIDSAVKKQDTTTAEKEEKSTQPIIVGGNTTNVIGNSKSSGGPGALVSSPIRNTESTFERVQMQAFWPRAK